jgi:hypothetical protein
MGAMVMIRPWHWAVIFMLAITAMAVGGTMHWINQANQSRAELRRSLAAIQTSNRAGLKGTWGDKINWTPAADASLALAVMPRTTRHNFDTIFACFEGQRVVATLALTSIGGFLNGEELNNKKHPDTLIGRRLSAEERLGLEKLIQLLEVRLKLLDPQSTQYGWTQQVLRIARTIQKMQEP